MTFLTSSFVTVKALFISVCCGLDERFRSLGFGGCFFWSCKSVFGLCGDTLLFEFKILTAPLRSPVHNLALTMCLNLSVSELEAKFLFFVGIFLLWMLSTLVDLFLINESMFLFVAVAHDGEFFLVLTGLRKHCEAKRKSLCQFFFELFVIRFLKISLKATAAETLAAFGMRLITFIFPISLKVVVISSSFVTVLMTVSTV